MKEYTESKKLLEEGHSLSELIELFDDKQEQYDLYVNSGLVQQDFNKIIDALKNQWIPVFVQLPCSDGTYKVLIFDDWTKKTFESEVSFETGFKVADGNYVAAWKQS